MSEITDAFAELQAANSEALGEDQMVTIGGTTCAAIVEAVPLDSVYVDGGLSEKQSFKLMIAASALSGTPSKYDSVSFTPSGHSQAVSLEVLSVDENNGILNILVGDPNSHA